MDCRSYPSSARIASRCWPSVGGGVRTDGGVADSLIGEPITLIGPTVG